MIDKIKFKVFSLWGPHKWLTILVILINLGRGIGMIEANAQQLAELMEK